MRTFTNSYVVEKVKGSWLTVNRACNMRCEWCYAAGTEFDTKRNMNIDLAYQLIDVMADLNVKSMVLIGGEPTLYKHLIEIINYANERSILPVMVTNGVRFSDKDFCKRVLDAGLKKVTISLKGTSEEQYVKLTSSKGFTKMIKGVENLRSLGIEPSFEITIVKEYLDNLEELFTELANIGVNHLTVDLVSPIITDNQIDAPSVPDPFELAKAVNRIYYSVDSSAINYVIYMTIPFCLLNPEVLQGLKDEDRLMSSCHVPHGNALIFDEIGRILSCNHMASHAIGQWGVDFKSAQDFLEYWNTSELQNFRSTCSCYPAEPCKTCPYWGECGGGCMIKWLRWNPKEFIGSLSITAV